MFCGQKSLQPTALFGSLIINFTSYLLTPGNAAPGPSLHSLSGPLITILMDRSDIDILIQKTFRMRYVVLDVGGEKFRVKRKILAR